MRSETHRHWHFLDFERYELLAPDGKLLGRDRKTGFCLGDRYDAHASVELPGEPAEPVWTQECGRGQPARLLVREGISPGYGDDYVPRLSPPGRAIRPPTPGEPGPRATRERLWRQQRVRRLRPALVGCGNSAHRGGV